MNHSSPYTALLLVTSLGASLACSSAPLAPPIQPPAPPSAAASATTKTPAQNPSPPQPAVSPVDLATLEAASPDEEAVARMANTRGCWSPSFSPDGKQLAFVSDMNGIPQVWTIPSGGGFPTLVTMLADPVGRVTWSPDGAWLAFSVAPGGGMNQQIYLVHPDGTGLRRQTKGGKENNFMGDWTHDGRQLSFSSNVRNPASTDSYLLDITSGQPTFVADNQGIGGIADVSRDGGYAVVSRMKSRSSEDLFLLDLKAKKEALMTPHEGPGEFFGGTFSTDGRTIYLASNKDRDMIAFAKVKLGKDNQPGPIEVITARDDAELDGFELNDQRTTAALLWNAGGRTELAFVDLRTSKATAGPALPAEIVRGVTFSKDGKRLAMLASGAAAPADVWILEFATKRFTQITNSPHPGIDLTKMVRPELVRYPAHDGLPLSGWLYRPTGAKTAGPVVLSFHGGPEGQERPSFNSTYQALLARGIAVFAPNVRGSSGFGKKFVNLDNGPLRENAVKDIKATVDYMVKSGVADARRIGIMGGSYGGYMVMAGLTEYPDLLAAGANLFGVVNFETFFKHTEPWMAAISTIEYGNPETEKDMLRKLSPIHRIDRVKAPTLVLHGQNDTNVPVVEAEQVVQTLAARGVPVSYVLFPDEGHGWRKTPNRIRAAVAIVRWFDKYLNAK